MSPAAPPGGAGRRYYGWTLVIVLGIVTVVTYGTSQYLFGLLVLPAGHDLGASRASISAAYSIGLVVAGVLGVPVGRYVDRHGARGVLLAGSAVAIATLVGLAHARSLLAFDAWWAIGNGLAMGLSLYPVTFVVVANWFDRRRGSAMALFTMIGGLSSPIFIPLSGWLIAHDGWRAALMWIALTQVAILPLEAIFVRRHPEDMGLHPDGLPPLAGTAAPQPDSEPRDALGRPAFWLLTVAGSAGLLAGTALLVHQVPYMIGRGLSPILAASIAGIPGLTSVPARITLNAPPERLSPQRLLILSFTLMAVAVVILLLARSPAAFVAYAITLGMGYGTVNPLRALVMAQHFGRRAYGTITAVQNVATIVASAAGPLLAGALYDASGSYASALIAVLAACLVAALATLLTPKPPARAA